MNHELPTLPDDLSPVRAVWCRNALTIYGYTAGDGNFERLVDPGDPESVQAQIVRLSCCELARAGLEEMVLDVPVRTHFVGGAVTALLQSRAGGTISHPAGALRACTLETPPSHGDGIWWSKSPAAEEHVDACVVSVSVISDTEQVLTVIASGLRNAQGLETVGVEDRHIRFDGHGWIDLINERRIAAVLDAELYAQPLRATA